MIELKERFLAGETFAEFLARPKNNDELWKALYQRAILPPDILERAGKVEQAWHLLVLNEDWCGDSVNILPQIAKLVGAMQRVDMRILSRDANLDLMDKHLTGTSRSIPVIILLDIDYVERGWWGPRPRVLQKWVVEQGLVLSKDDRYREVRTWYARDHGKTSLTEVLDMIEAVRDAAG